MKYIFIVLLVLLTGCSIALDPKEEPVTISINTKPIQLEVKSYNLSMYLTPEQDSVEPYNTNFNITTVIYDTENDYVWGVGADIKRVIGEDGLNYIKIICYYTGNTPDAIFYTFRYDNGEWMDSLIIKQFPTADVPFNAITGSYGWAYNGINFYKKF